MKPAAQQVLGDGATARRYNGGPVSQWLMGPVAKPLLFAACLLPVGWLFYAAWSDALGANPAEALIRSLGDWTLRLLCITLAVTPLRQLSGLSALARFRRMFGLFTWFYACLHFLAYSWLDMGMDFGEIARDIAKRPFILVGALMLVLMTPLAATSFNRAVKWLGAQRWRSLHRMIYLIALLALLHFFWMRAGKNDFAEVAVYATVIALLFGWRIAHALRHRYGDGRAA